MALVRTRDRVPSERTLRKAWKSMERSGSDPVRELRQIGTWAECVFLTYIEQTRGLRDAQAAAAKSIALESGEESLAGGVTAYENMLTTFLEEVLESAEFRSFAPTVRSAGRIAKKDTYRLDLSSAAGLFAARHLETQLRHELQSKFGNRNSIADLVAESSSWNFSRTMVQADVKEFYETISHEALIERLENDANVSSFSVRSVLSLLQSYKSVSGRTKGIPRGVALSAYISEYVLSQFDEDVRSDPNCILYVRYVDDIYAVFAPVVRPETLEADFTQKLSQLGLELSPKASKRRFESVATHRTPRPLEYLGYRFTFGAISNKPRVALSTQRMKRLTERIENSFSVYALSRRGTWERALLLDRIRFISSNTKLSGNKRNAYIGIRFSQRALTDLAQIDELDNLIQKESAKLNDPALADKLSRLSCRQGFKNPTFHIWEPSRLKELSLIWRKP